MKKKAKKQIDWIAYYDDVNILDEIKDEMVDLSLDENLRRDILSGKRKRRLKNITIKVDFSILRIRVGIEDNGGIYDIIIVSRVTLIWTVQNVIDS